MAEFASKGVAGAGLGLGIAGTALGLLMGGTNLLGFNANNNQASEKPITRYEYEMGEKLAQKDSEITLLKSEQNVEVKIADVYARLKADLLTLERNQNEKNAQQGVINQSITDNLGIINTQLVGINNTLGEITQVKIPNSAVCPGWGGVNVTPTACGGCGCTGSTSLY